MVVPAVPCCSQCALSGSSGKMGVLTDECVSSIQELQRKYQAANRNANSIQGVQRKYQAANRMLTVYRECRGNIRI